MIKEELDYIELWLSKQGKLQLAVVENVKSFVDLLKKNLLGYDVIPPTQLKNLLEFIHNIDSGSDMDSAIKKYFYGEKEKEGRDSKGKIQKNKSTWGKTCTGPDNVESTLGAALYGNLLKVHALLQEEVQRLLTKPDAVKERAIFDRYRGTNRFKQYGMELYIRCLNLMLLYGKGFAGKEKINWEVLYNVQLDVI